MRSSASRSMRPGTYSSSAASFWAAEDGKVVMKHADPPRFHRGLDRLGIVASAVCLVHCLCTPLFLVSLPIVASEGFEGIFMGVLVGFAILSVGLGVLRHRLRPLLPLTLGLATLALLHVVDVNEGSPLELVGTTVTALLMILTHLMSLDVGVADAAA